MLIDLLIQNYYEVNGNFKGIELTAVGNKLRSRSRETGLSIEDLCYESLGFKNRKYFEQAASDYSSGLATETLKELGVGSTKHNSYVESIPDKLARYVKTLASYYKSVSMVPVVIDDMCMTFKDSIMLLSSKCRSLKDIEKYAGIKDGFVTFVLSDTRDNVITANKFFVKDLTAKEQQKIHDAALTAVVLKTGLEIPSNLKMKANEFIFTSIAYPKKYRELILYAGMRGMTYKQLLETIGICVPNQFDMYSKAGVIGYHIDGNFFYVDDDNCKIKSGNIFDILRCASGLKSMEVF